MKITTLLDHIEPNFIKQYLSAKGVDDIGKYTRPDMSCFDNPMWYINMQDGINMLSKHIANESKIGILMDSDMDGCCSAAMMYLYLDKNAVVFSHSGKQHGINDKLEDIIASGVNLLIVPDAGTNDIAECATLHDAGIDVLVLDHHDISCDNPYAVVINNQRGNVNHALSGTGVTYQFIAAYDEAAVSNYKYMDLVAMSIVSDVCNLISYENRAFIHYGLNHITNPFLYLLFEKECKQRGKTPDAIGWCIAPLANALSRVDNQDTKMLFFNALVGNGDDDIDAMLAAIKRVKRQQDEKAKETVNEITPNLDFSHKAIIGFTSPENKGFIGLIANKFLGKYGKPTILLRELNSTTWSGSLRAPIDMADLINETKLAECAGHQAACGIVIKKANLNKFAKWLDTLDMDVDPDVNVCANISAKDVTLPLAQSITDNAELWGNNLPNPTFHIVLNNPDVYVYKKRTTTLKLVQDGIDFIKFFADDKMIDAIQNRGNAAVELICTIKTNEYNGVISPQCMIEDWSLINKTEIKEEYDWENIFE